jgi:hypothetical protein
MTDAGEREVLPPSDSQLQWVARDLCIKLGLCAIGRAIENIRELPTMDPAAWADEVFRIEKMDPNSHRELWTRARDLIGDQILKWSG